jgi:hypothetical protein
MGWFSDVAHFDAAKNIIEKFKNLRKVLREWNQTISNLKQNIANVKLILVFMNYLEEL